MKLFVQIMCGRCATDGDGDVGMIINVPAFNCISCENAYAGVGYFLIEIVLVLQQFCINITNGNPSMPT